MWWIEMYYQTFCLKNISVYYLQEIISTSKFLLWKELKYFFALINNYNYNYRNNKYTKYILYILKKQKVQSIDEKEKNSIY